MLNASVGVQRALGRLRRPQNDRPASDAPARPGRTPSHRKVRRGFRSVAVASRLAPIREHRATSAVETPVVVASVAAPAEHALLISASGPIARSPSRSRRSSSAPRSSASRPASAGAATGGTNGAGTAPASRSAVALPATSVGPTRADGTTGSDDYALAAGGATDSTLSTAASNRPAGRGDQARLAVRGHRFRRHGDLRDKCRSVEGPFLDDGTLLKPVAVDTTVADGSGLMQNYKVKSGDTLTGIATSSASR